MHGEFKSVEEAVMALAEPGGPRWAAAFAYLSSHPETAAAMLETFRETLEQMGVEPTGTDPASGEPVFTIADVAGAMGISAEELEAAAAGAGDPGNGGDDR